LSRYASEWQAPKCENTNDKKSNLPKNYPLFPEDGDETANDAQIDDDAEKDDVVPAVGYDISSYGIDFDVAGLIEHIKSEKVLVPKFQRSYVWTLPQASRFIESLLLGLPVPGIFLAKVAGTNKLLVIDGQQRLKSLQFYLAGVFRPEDEEGTSKRLFKLQNVQDRFLNKTFEELEDSDQQMIEDSVIHATVVRQETPKGDDTSIYHVYERLNSGGTRLAPHEIRTAVCQGTFMECLRDLNKNTEWRALFGPKGSRLKDQEMILRFFALYENISGYSRPMSEFLTTYAEAHCNPSANELRKYRERFEGAVKIAHEAIGDVAFRPERNFNAAVFDSVMIGLAHRLDRGAATSKGIAAGGAAGPTGTLPRAIAGAWSPADEPQTSVRGSNIDARALRYRLPYDRSALGERAVGRE